MVVMTQNKAGLVNFENLVVICTNESSITAGEWKVEAYYDNRYISLGTYETEKRAKDILEKIVNAYGLGMYMYQMPKK